MTAAKPIPMKHRGKTDDRGDADDGAKPFPHNLEAERALLGAALQQPGLVERHGEQLAGRWYRRSHEELWTLLRAMLAAGVPIDLVTVPEEVARIESSERGGRTPREPGRFGGVSYVCELPDHTPSIANASYYATLIETHGRRRALIALLHAAAERLYDGREDPSEIAAFLTDRIDEMEQPR